MSTETRQTGAARKKTQAVWAWMGVAFTPGLVVVGVVVAQEIGFLLGYNMSHPLTFGQNLAVGVPAALIWLAGPVFGLVKGIQASREGSRSGTVAAVVAGLLALALLISVVAEFL